MAARRGTGFTLVELTAILLLIAVFAAVVFLRFEPAESTVGFQADRLARDIRHMQAIAMYWGVRLRLTASATSYSVACVGGGPSPPCNGTNPIIDPAPRSDQPSFAVSLQNGVTLSPGTLDVDPLGRPLTTAGTLATTTTAFTLTGGAKTQTVSVIPLTGFVTVN